jgi:hypothetical protein
VVGVGGADELVVADPELVPERLEAAADLVGVLLGGASPAFGRLFDLLAVFIGPGEEEGLQPRHAGVDRQGVGDDGGVGVADVGDVVDVIDGRGDVGFFAVLGHGDFP